MEVRVSAQPRCIVRNDLFKALLMYEAANSLKLLNYDLTSCSVMSFHHLHRFLLNSDLFFLFRLILNIPFILFFTFAINFFKV